MFALFIAGHCPKFRPAQAVTQNVMTAFGDPRNDFGVAFQSNCAGGNGDRNLAAVQETCQSPDAGTASIFKMRLRAEVTNGITNVEIELPPIIVAAVPIGNGIFGTFLVNNDEVDCDQCTAGPAK